MSTEVTDLQGVVGDAVSVGKHTPGPWRIKRSITQMCDEATTITSVGGSGRSYHPRWWIFSDAETHGDPGADAVLISCAPELLAALQRIKREAANESRNPIDSCNRICDLADAALAKATGEAS